MSTNFYSCVRAMCHGGSRQSRRTKRAGSRGDATAGVIVGMGRPFGRAVAWHLAAKQADLSESDDSRLGAVMRSTASTAHAVDDLVPDARVGHVMAKGKKDEVVSSGFRLTSLICLTPISSIKVRRDYGERRVFVFEVRRSFWRSAS